MELNGKVAFVTGGGRGIGRETCLLLASHGADIAICARSEQECMEVAQTIESKYAVKTVVVICDVSDAASVQQAVQKVESTLGSIDILINNAGAMLMKPLVDTSIDEWNWIQNINVNGPFYLSKAVVPSMLKKQDGVIINISSIWGTKGGPNRSAYITSKHAILGFSKALGEELKSSGIRVNAVCPGPVDTKMMEELGPDLNKTGWLHPIDIANVIVDLCLPKSKAIMATYIEAFGTGSPVGLASK